MSADTDHTSRPSSAESIGAGAAGGAAAGAVVALIVAVGSVVAPFIGTAIGSGIGAALGWLVDNKKPKAAASNDHGNGNSNPPAVTS